MDLTRRGNGASDQILETIEKIKMEKEIPNGASDQILETSVKNTFEKIKVEKEIPNGTSDQILETSIKDTFENIKLNKKITKETIDQGLEDNTKNTFEKFKMKRKIPKIPTETHNKIIREQSLTNFKQKIWHSEENTKERIFKIPKLLTEENKRNHKTTKFKDTLKTIIGETKLTLNLPRNNHPPLAKLLDKEPIRKATHINEEANEPRKIDKTNLKKELQCPKVKKKRMIKKRKLKNNLP